MAISDTSYAQAFQFLNGTIGVLTPSMVVDILFPFQFLNGTIGVTRSKTRNN